MRSIVRRDGGAGYEAWLRELARSSGIETPTRAKLDRKRPKKGSNAEWVHPGDPEARITKMKDGRTRLGHKLEQAVDLESGAVVGMTVQTTDGGDAASLTETLDEAERRLAELGAGAAEVVCDKGCHSNKTMTELEDRGLRGYVSEPARGRRSWKKNKEAQKPVYANRRRIRGERGKALLRMRGEKLERSFAHLLATGGLRRVHVRGHEDIRKRMLIHVAAFNLGLLMRRRFGVGTPRGLQGRPAAAQAVLDSCATGAASSVLRRFCRQSPLSSRSDASWGRSKPNSATPARSRRREPCKTAVSRQVSSRTRPTRLSTDC